ncbi:hypothetical protein EDB81DRAFT_156848 [Dactylonectria macrodidyma]|uniref:Uncharacterized protein n=1 Tax=Dactylonectria macrodidyma TaxID=307937 RepID=A0A9P9JL76_9HYPO|nr:hypothetical protein EDB81DRAFT_156848 [Dactylonectria macrodidyma]
MTDLVRKCASDVASFEARLQRLQLSGVHCRRTRFWRRMHTTLSEKDLEQMRDVIRSHVLMLNFRLSLVETTQLSLSTTQTSEILNLLQKLNGDASILHPLGTSYNYSFTASSDLTLAEIEKRDASPPAVDSSFKGTVSRLMQLVLEKECTVDSEEAEQFITDLGTLVTYAQNSKFMPQPGAVETNTRKYQPQETDEGDLKDLRLVSYLISSASSVAINRNGQVGGFCAISQGDHR